MAWYDDKSTAADPDNPAANEQITADEWDAMVLYLKDKISNITVDSAAIGNDKILVYKTATTKFVFETPSTIAALDDLTDVVISGVPADNEVLAYDTGTSKFINQTAAEAGLALVANVVLEADFNATTFLYATADNTPQPKTVAETLAILSVESGADVTDATNVNAAGAVMESDFDATTFLYATADNTPLPKTPAETLAILSGTAAAEFLFNTQKIGGIVDPTTAQQAATKNYADTRVATKELVTSFTDDYVLVYKTASGKFEMEAQSAAVGLPVVDTTSIIKGSADGTKQVRFEVDGLSTGVTRVITMPDKDITLSNAGDYLLLDGSQVMAGNIKVADTKGMQSNVNDGYVLVNGGTIGAGMMTLYGGSHATYPGALWLAVCAADGILWETALSIAGVTDTPIVDILHGLDMNGKAIDDIGDLILNDATELTIAAGSVTITQSYHTIDTQNDDATDNLVAIGGGTTGQIIVLRAANEARTVVVKDDTDIKLNGDMSLDTVDDSLTLIYTGTYWVELSRSDVNTAYVLADGSQVMAATFDMDDNIVKDMKNSAATALSGTQKDIEIDIGGVPYYFTVYPTKA